MVPPLSCRLFHWVPLTTAHAVQPPHLAIRTTIYLSGVEPDGPAWVAFGYCSCGPAFPPYCLNPNWTGWGQIWPSQLWPKIAGKLIKYHIIFYTYSCKNVFRIFLNFWHDLKKWRFDVHFDIFLSEFRPRHPLPNPPPSARFYCYYRSPEGGRSPAGQWSAVLCGASQKFQSVSGHRPRRMRGVACSQLGPLSHFF
jgi:hypothetical protein